MMFVTLLAAGYGYLFLDSRPFYGFLSTLVPPWKAYFWMILSRMCIIALWVLLLFALVVFLAVVNGAVLSAGDYAGLTAYMAAALIMLFFFFFIGVISGTVPQKDIGLTILFGSWLVFLYVIPGIITDIADRYNPGISAGYQAELDKFKTVSDFEKKAKKETGGFDSSKIEVGRKVTNNFLENDFKKVKAVEKEFIDRVSVYRDHYNALALLTPVSFFQLTGNEVSSRGFESFLDYYRYCSDLQEKFARFYIDRCFNHDIRELVSFIKDDENIYYSRTRVPGNYGRGIIIGLCWVVLLAVAGFYRFLAYLFRVDAPGKLQPGNRAVILSKSELKAYGIKKISGFNEKLFNLFSGRFHRVKTGETIKIEIANRDLSDNRKPINFAYICRPSHIPVDISSRAFIRFVARLSGVSRAEGKTLSAAARLGAYSPGKVFSLVLPYIKREIYLVDNAALDMPGEFLTRLNDIMKDWAASGASVLYLTTERGSSEEKYKKEKSGCDFTEEKMWSETVSRLKELNPAARGASL